MKRSLLLLILSFVSLDARYHTITSENSFENLVNKYPYSVVCFIPSKPESKEVSKEEKRETRDDFRDLKTRLRSASESGKFKRYLQREFGFLLVDVASRRAQELDDELNLNKLPTCLLFKHGKPMMSYGQIFEPISKYSILKFVKKNFEDDLDSLIKDKKEEEQLKREERIASYQAYGRFGYPAGWGGYWGYSPGYHWGYGGFGYRGYRGCW